MLDVHVPGDVSAAAELMAAGATVLGGGTSLMPRLTDGESPPTRLVSLRKAGLSGVQVHGADVRLGAGTTLAQIEFDDRLAVLNPVVRSIASRPVRSLATVAGNLFVPQPYGDLAVALVALDARVEGLGANGEYRESVEELIERSGAGAPGLVTAITFTIPEPGTFRYLKAARRRFNSASIVTIAATLAQVDGVVATARVALGGVGPRVIRARAVESALVGQALDEQSVAAAGAAGIGEIAPADDAYASAWYRSRVFPVHLRRALLGH